MTFEFLRKRIGTQADIAKMLSVHKSTVNKWESGLNYPRRPMLNKLAAILGVSESEILLAIDASKHNREVI